jgi:multiple RNA-binding domain-containing protein 1
MAAPSAPQTSRIFIKGLPPSISEAELRKHLASIRGGSPSDVTDVKLIPQRRIGYVGYKSPEDAAKAVKYFNKSYVRMSKISVEPAKAVSAIATPPLKLWR